MAAAIRFPMTQASELRTPTIGLSPAQLEDAQDLAALRVEAMRESLERVGRFDPTRAAQRFLASFSPAHTRHIVVDDHRVGFVVVKSTTTFILLDHLYIRPADQGKKIGSTVLSLVFAEARAQGLPVRLGALRDSPSNRFYIRHGFKLSEQSEFDNYYTREL